MKCKDTKYSRNPFRGNLSFCSGAIHPRAATTQWHHGIGYRDGTPDGVLGVTAVPP